MGTCEREITIKYTGIRNRTHHEKNTHKNGEKWICEHSEIH